MWHARACKERKRSRSDCKESATVCVGQRSGIFERPRGYLVVIDRDPAGNSSNVRGNSCAQTALAIKSDKGKKKKKVEWRVRG